MTEKILQFGTGRFLRAFADFFIDEARTSGRYDGTIVMVASTPSGRLELFNNQKGQYTLWTRGHGLSGSTNEFHTVNSVSRVLSANQNWNDVLRIALSENLEVILSNTTEIGLSLQENDSQALPQSFPGRLCALLYDRAECFNYATSKGVTILPCELVDHNGDLLHELVLEQAREWKLAPRFTDWLDQSTLFCNTLVDRIVPGLPGRAELEEAYTRIGFVDELLTVCEPYRLWAIQGDPSLKERLGFLENSEGIVLTSDIAPYRTRKIRLLNGGHTLSVPIALLIGCETVLECMNHPLVSKFIESLLRDEIGPVLPVDPDSVTPYVDEVLQRWRNPYMHHRLLDITLQSTTKLQHRVVPTLSDYYKKHPNGPAPRLIASGFAAWLRFMRGSSKSKDIVYGSMRGKKYPIYDDHAEKFLHWWPSEDQLIPDFVEDVLSDQDLWGISLNGLPGFTEAVKISLRLILQDRITSVLSGTEGVS